MIIGNIGAVLKKVTIIVDIDDATLIVTECPQPPPAVAAGAIDMRSVGNGILRRLTLPCSIGVKIFIGLNEA